MKQLFGFALMVLAVVSAACSSGTREAADNRLSIIGSGNMVSRQAAISGFDQIEAGFAFDVTIRQGEDFAVEAMVDDNLVDYLYLEKQGQTLQIGLKPGYAYDIPQANMIAEVTLPNLTAVTLSGSSRARLYDFRKLESFEAELTGSTALEGTLAAASIKLALSGGSYANLAGSTGALELEICGSSLASLRNLVVEEVQIDASCASTTVLNVKKSLDGDVSQNAQVYYHGNPQTSGTEVVQYATLAREES